MQEESRWRYALAQQIASRYQVNPKVAAVLVEGSVARDYADRSSDIDLAVFWTEPPTAQERRDIVTRAGGRDRHPWPSHREAAGWETRNVRERVSIDVRHTTVKATERIQAAVLERADPSLSKQQRLAALHSVYLLRDLIEETFRLVETHLGEVDTHAARERFRGQRRAWEQAPGGLG